MGSIERIETTSETKGDDDTLYGDQGNDILFGGAASDTIGNNTDHLEAGNDIIFGDHGFVDYVTADGDRTDIDVASSGHPNKGGSDTIDAGTGDDIVFGGTNNPASDPNPSDTIHAGNGQNIVFGDNGAIISAVDDSSRWGALPLTLGLVETINPSVGGSDTITTLEGDDIILGGYADDTIAAGDGNNIVLGDNGFVDFVGADMDPSDIDQIKTTHPTLGDRDDITTGIGNDFILGGSSGDTIRAGAGNDLVFGDHGDIAGDVNANLLPLATLNPAFTFTAIDTLNDVASTTSARFNDLIFGEAGQDILLGQQGSDTIDGGAGDDDLIGGHNVAGGHDGGDNLDGGSGDDVIAGDNAVISRRGDSLSQRMRVLSGSTIYGEGPIVDGLVLVTGDPQIDPTGFAQRQITLLDHAEDTSGDVYGDDYIAGGAHDDEVFGQLGDDVIQGDGSIDELVFAGRDQNGSLVLDPSVEGLSDGDDYIEGNGGDDVIFGNLGQDGIVGGSSSLFGLTSLQMRPDGSDLIFGGAGTRVDRNEFVTDKNGDQNDATVDIVDTHTSDADTILGDNGEIYRLVGYNGTVGGDGTADIDIAAGFLAFNYDTYGESRRIIASGAALLDYTPGGKDIDPDVGDPDPTINPDRGSGDEIHGETGDDFVYGMVGSDRLFGDSEDDDLIAGYGPDWVSGGTGRDGVLGDDGRIYTSRNTTEGEPLYAVAGLANNQLNQTITTPGKIQEATINVGGELKETVNMTPFNPTLGGQSSDLLYGHTGADDIVFGGLGADSLHGGPGDDAVSGAEALALDDPDNAAHPLEFFFDNPGNPGDYLRFGEDPTRSEEFLAYNEFAPLEKVFVDRATGVFADPGDAGAVPFVLNFDAGEGQFIETVEIGGAMVDIFSDGDDRIFGDLGNDYLVGGTGRDNLYGGFGSDLLNADDDHDTAGGLNNEPDSHVSYEDRAFGGAGRDVLIANTAGDRLIDYAGAFNSYVVPFAPFGAFTITRAVQPQLFEFLYDLSESDGADPTRAADTGADPLRNGEPFGELGLVTQADPFWQDQTGAPGDIQRGNIPGGPRDVVRSSDFDDGQALGFAADTGSWEAKNGRLFVSPDSPGSDAVTVYHVDTVLPSYYEVVASVSGAKAGGGFKSDAFTVFDYQSATDFKFAGIDVQRNKLLLGHRVDDIATALAELPNDYEYIEYAEQGWIVDAAVTAPLSADRLYSMKVAINGTAVTLVLNNDVFATHVFAPRVEGGLTFGLNTGMIGFGANNSVSSFDNIAVQVLPPELTLEKTEDFTSGAADLFTGPTTGDWTISGDRYIGTPNSGAWALSFVDLSAEAGLEAGEVHLQSYSILKLSTSLKTSALGGVVFDASGPDRFKFAALSPARDLLVIGHYTAKRGLVHDAEISVSLNPDELTQIDVSLKGTTASVSVNGRLALSHAFNAVVVDGGFGLLTQGGSSSFDSVSIKTDDPAFAASDSGLTKIQLNGYGETYFESFDSLGAAGSELPTGWTATTSGVVNTTITNAFPATAVASGTYNAGSGDDRTLATGNINGSDSNTLQLWAELTGPNDVWAVVFETRVEAWFGDTVLADDPGEAAVLVTLEFDPEKDGTYQTAETFNGGAPITTGLVLSPGSLDGNGAAGTALVSGLIVLPAAIPAGSDIRLTFDAQGVGQTTGYIFGIDDVLLRIVSPGDTDANGAVDSNDLFAILAAGKFNHPELGPATWGEGDFTGDTLVDSSDLFAMLASGNFNAGPYSSEPAATIVDSSSVAVDSGGDALAEVQQASQLLVAQIDEPSAAVSTSVTTWGVVAGRDSIQSGRLHVVRSLNRSQTSPADQTNSDGRLPLISPGVENAAASLRTHAIDVAPPSSQLSFTAGDATNQALRRRSEVDPLINGRRASVDSFFKEFDDMRSRTIGNRRKSLSEHQTNAARRNDEDDFWREAFDLALEEEPSWLDGPISD